MENEYSKKARMYFKEGYNCAQAVFLAFSQELGIDKKTAARLASSFGGGMGRLREVCGAVSAMFMIAGLKKGYEEALDHDGKKEHYRFIQELAEIFKQKNGSIICRILLDKEEGKDDFAPEERTKKYYSERPCEKFVGDAADIIYERIFG